MNYHVNRNARRAVTKARVVIHNAMLIRYYDINLVMRGSKQCFTLSMTVQRAAWRPFALTSPIRQSRAQVRVSVNIDRDNDRDR